MVFCQCYRIGFINFFYSAFLCILAYFDSSTSRIVTFFTAIYLYQIDNSGPLISPFIKITNQRSIIFLKLLIYIQIVIRLASIHRLSICIIDLPTTDNSDYRKRNRQCSVSGSTCFLASRIRIHSEVWIRIRLWIRILLSFNAKLKRKTFNPNILWLFLTFYLWKIM